MPHIRSYFEPGDYLFAADLVDKNGNPIKATVTIASVEQGKLPVKGTSRTERKPVLTFVNRRKKLALNKTNAGVISAMYGQRTEAWQGKQITLYATTCHGISGGVVECIRVIPSVPAGKPQELPPDTEPAAETAALSTEDDGAMS